MSNIMDKVKELLGNLKKMRKRNRVIIGAAAVLLIIFVVVLTINVRNRANAASQYQTDTVNTGDLTATIGATGTVHANQTAILTWQTSGKVAEVSAQIGDQVQAGDVLASLAQTSLSQNIVLAQADLVTAQRNLDSVLHSNTKSAQAQVDLIAAQKNYDSAKSSLDTLSIQNRGGTSADIQQARSKLALAQDACDRAQTAYDNVKDNPDSDPSKAQAYLNLYNAQQSLHTAQNNLNYYLMKPSTSSTNQAQANFALAEAKLADAQREWDRLKNGPDPNDVAAAQARVDAAQATIDMSRLIAPFGGTITDATPMLGDLVSPGTSGFRVDDLSHKLVDVQVSEVDINSVQVNQPVTLTFDAIPNKNYNARVVEVVQAGSVVQGAVTFTVTVELTDADAMVKPGMTAAVSIIIHQINDVLLVPNRAVRLVNGQRVVYILQNGKVVEIPITLGASSDTVSEVVSGDLKKGDQIILNPPATFTQGPQGGGGMFGGGG